MQPVEVAEAIEPVDEFGLAARRWHRLGAGIVAHAINNSLFIAAVAIASRTLH
jgi:hypothetical protein